MIYRLWYALGARSWRRFWCRLKGHPAGVVWFTGPEATDPDMRCKECGEDLG